MLMTINFSGWTKATGDLKPGQQAVFLDFLNLVKDGKAHLVHGANYRDGKPCLVNGVATMLSHSSVSPIDMFPAVVGEFDGVCGQMERFGLNEGLGGYVSPLMAEVLIRNFGDVKPMEITEPTADVEKEAPYIEPSDAAMQAALASMLAPSPEVLSDADINDEMVEYARSFVNIQANVKPNTSS